MTAAPEEPARAAPVPTATGRSAAGILLACGECDLLLRVAALPPGRRAACPRCGAVVLTRKRDSLRRTLAFALASAVLFCIANAFPIVGIDVHGNRSATTLLGAVQTLWDQDMRAVATLVFVTTFLVPALDLAALCWLLLPLQFGRRPAGFAPLMRVVHTLRPWGMVEVFLLGVLVSLVKLAHLALVVPGMAMWSFAALMLTLAATASSFDAEAVWARLPNPR
jgi:paraquat-inducible protein A